MFSRLFISTTLLACLTVSVAAETVSGTVSEWYGGAPGVSPRQRGLSGATVVAGPDLDLAIGQAGFDYVKGNVVVKGETNERGAYSINLPAGRYVIIYWKQGYTPQVDTVVCPGTLDASIDRDRSGQQLHKALKYGNP
jgi:hypothetical protein